MNNRVLALIPMRPAMHPALRQQCFLLLERMMRANPTLEIDALIDQKPEPKRPEDVTPWAKVMRVRNRILDGVDLDRWDWLLWIDADMVLYPSDMPTRLIEACACWGVAAPLVLLQDTDRFCDWCAFIINGNSHIAPGYRSWVPGRNLTPHPPYWPQQPTERVMPMDSVGAITLVHTDIYKAGARYEDHPTFTDHWPICQKAKEMGLPVVVDRNCVSYHADSPRYGEQWHGQEFFEKEPYEQWARLGETRSGMGCIRR